MDNKIDSKMDKQIENNQLLDQLKYDDKGLIPAVVQEYNSGKVLMLAYMNKDSLKKTLGTGIAHYWSRSREELWKKGETSGHYQYVKSIDVDCDGDALLLKVVQKGVACHTGNYTCFFRALLERSQLSKADINKGYEENKDSERFDGSEILKELYCVISDRKAHPKEDSYTNYLFDKGIDKILKKVGEEASEVIIAAKNNSFEELRYEISDLVYHTLVLMIEQGLELGDIYEELRSRR